MNRSLLVWKSRDGWKHQGRHALSGTPYKYLKVHSGIHTLCSAKCSVGNALLFSASPNKFWGGFLNATAVKALLPFPLWSWINREHNLGIKIQPWWEGASNAERFIIMSCFHPVESCIWLRPNLCPIPEQNALEEALWYTTWNLPVRWLDWSGFLPV